MKTHKIKAFTLVELIIVITILAILATIGFLSYQSYTLDARDSSRITSLREIYKGLQIYQTKKSILPYPDEQVTTISDGTSIISNQGYIGTNVLSKIRSSEIVDPKDKLPYTYTINGDGTRFQLLAILENTESIKINAFNKILNNSYAANNYNDRSTYIIGNLVGIFLNNITNAPVQETLTGINLETDTEYYKVVFSNPTNTNSGVLIGNGSDLSTQINIISNSTNLVENTNISIPTCTAGQGFNGTSCVAATTCTGGLTEITLANLQTWSCMNLGATSVWDGTTQPLNCGGIATNCNSSLTWMGDYYQRGKNDTSRINGNAGSPYNSGWEAQNNTRWGGSTSDTSISDGTGTTRIGRQGPCPTGRHVPSAKDWQNMCNVITGVTCTNAMALNSNIISKLKLPYSGYRLRTTGAYNTQKTNAFYWSSSPTTTIKPYTMVFNTANFRPTNSVERAYGLPVRCIKN